jgi:glycine/D-amino acid oxidase-like deaminating enzyme
MKVVVIGAGIIGAAIAFGLTRRGASVVVIDRQGVGGEATARTFGWINASFYHDDHHHRMRAEAIAAWHRTEAALGADLVDWCGALCWEEQGAALAAQAARLSALGYRAEVVDGAEVARREPALAMVPEAALWLPQEGVLEEGAAARLLAASGARVIAGVTVTGIDATGGQVRAVQTDAGDIAADQVVIAAGAGASALMTRLGVPFTMPPRPGLILRSAPLPPMLRHVLVTPEGEIRQDRAGRITMPAAVGHQEDASDRIEGGIAALADAAMARLRRILPDAGDWEEAAVGWRPVPADGLPAIGAVGPKGAYLAVMHSGVTLAALVGEAVVEEIIDGRLRNDLGPYRPQRFA